MVERKTEKEIIEQVLGCFSLDKVWLSEEGVKEALARVSERSEAEAESNGHESAVAQLQEELFGVDEE